MEQLSKKAIQEAAAKATGKSAKVFFVEIAHGSRRIFVNWQDSVKGHDDGVAERKRVKEAVTAALPAKYRGYVVSCT